MQFLNKEIEALTKKKKTKSLVRKQISCGIFQEVEGVGNMQTESAPKSE